jgi:hypothetical protein
MMRLTGIALVLLLGTAFAARGGEENAVPPESVCLQCHGAQQGRLGAPVKLWRSSVHASGGISCHSCHGGDPNDFAMAMSPERGFIGVPKGVAIPDFCGRCHVGVREDYLTSAHGKALGKGGAHCVTCHGNHAVVPASLDLINDKDCSRCHAYGRAGEIREAMRLVDARIVQTDEHLGRLHRIGVATRALQGELFALRNDFHRLFHSVDIEKVRRETGQFNGRLDGMATRLETIDAELHRRRVVGGLVVAGLAVAGILLLLVRRTYREEEQRRSEGDGG